jgi:uncharacterized protein YbaA (DUF1428 family)
MAYVDGFVIPVRKKNLKAYLRMARVGARVFRDHGALEYRECVADDVRARGAASFPKTLRTRAGETLVFSWIVYRSKAQRASVMAKVMKDKRLEKFMDPKSMPFDMKRMLYAGFKLAVSA